VGSVPDSPLGKATHYAERYDPALLYAVERAPQRDALGLRAPLPFEGADAWTAWEANWLDDTGKPQVAVVRFDVPATSGSIVESKSVKLYFTALNQSRFAHADDYRATLARDLSDATGSAVRVQLVEPHDYARLARHEPAGESLDDLPLRAIHDVPDAAQLAAGGAPVAETLVTRLFRSVCPVTGQPDYATVQVAYRGARIDRESLLAYLCAFRRHPGFHEHCVERIFVDIGRACAPDALGVVARFTRRGGIDISPWRRAGDVTLAAAPTAVQ
jgi:7-cyano-7-deazaguanine reductase